MLTPNLNITEVLTHVNTKKGKKHMASKEKMTGIRLSDEQNFKIRYIAEQNYRNLNDEFRMIVDKRIEEYEKEHGRIDIKKD